MDRYILLAQTGWRLLLVKDKLTGEGVKPGMRILGFTPSFFDLLNNPQQKFFK